MATEGLKDVEVGLIFVPYHSPRCMPLLLDPVLHSLVAAGFVCWSPKLTAINPQGQIESNYDETVDNFDSMELKPELLRGEFPNFRCAQPK